MTQVMVFHHVLGVTDGVREFAEHLRAAGHAVTLADLFDGRTFTTREDGREYVKQVGLETILARGVSTAAESSHATFYVGFSLGTLPAQKLAQTQPRARGAVLCYGFTPPLELGSEWPSSMPVQIHAMENDPLIQQALQDARQFARSVDRAELFLYRGDRHLFADRSTSDFDEEAAKLLLRRVLSFVAGEHR